MAEEKISISIDGTSFSSTAGDLGLYWENKEELNAAIGEYSGGNLLERFARTKKLEKEPLSLAVKASLDDEKLSAFVNDNCAPMCGRRGTRPFPERTAPLSLQTRKLDWESISRPPERL